MISPELLRRYPFFAKLDDSQLKAIAMITPELNDEKGMTFHREGDPGRAVTLYPHPISRRPSVEKLNLSCPHRDSPVDEEVNE
jgi:hypothetical protein